MSNSRHQRFMSFNNKPLPLFEHDVLMHFDIVLILLNSGTTPQVHLQAFQKLTDSVYTA